MGRTELLFKPSMEECVKAAVSHKMPEAEGRKFFYHYESNGWRVGKLPMQSFAGAMGGWYERWMERTGGSAPNPATNGKDHPPVLSGPMVVVRQKEYERLIVRMNQLRDGVEAHASGMTPKAREEWNGLVARKKQLKKELGIVV